MKSLKDVTVEEIAIGSQAFRDAILALVEAVVTLKDQHDGKVASHLLRRIFTDGVDLIKYDPGDEPAIEFAEQ